MAIDQPGLLQRLAGPEARRIASQHRQLDDLYALVRAALDAGERARARERLELFAGALDAHFSIEESFYFPALHGLDGGLAPELARLESDHRRLQDALRDLALRLDGDATALGDADLEALADDLRRHEAREEALVTRLSAEAPEGSR